VPHCQKVFDKDGKEAKAMFCCIKHLLFQFIMFLFLFPEPKASILSVVARLDFVGPIILFAKIMLQKIVANTI
jgi:hypothetical protein